MMPVRNPIRDVRWHGVTRCKETGLPKVSFLELDGSISYLRLDERSARHLIEAGGDYWFPDQAWAGPVAFHPVRTLSQSEKSEGSPISDVSTPDDGVKVCPPTTSSSAAISE